jgi:drug/metabolite transporter (DMT)-like permease
VEPIGFVAWRAAIGALVVGALLALAARRGRRVVRLGDVGRRARAALLAAAVAGLVTNLAMFIAFGRITVALALLGFYTYPAVVTLVASIRDRRPPDGIQLVALATALLGMALVVLGSLDPAAGIRFDLLGFGLTILAALSQTLFIIVSRGYARIPTEEATTVILVLDALGYVLIAAVVGSFDAIVLPLRTPGSWPLLLWAGVVGAGIPTFLFLTGIRWVGGVRTGILALFEPVVGVALAAIVLGEAVGPVQGLGGALVLAAGILLQVGRRVGRGGAPVVAQ